MRYCPHCRKPTAKQEGDCPHCGEDLNTKSSGAITGGSGAYEEMGGMALLEEEGGASLELDTGYMPTPSPSAVDQFTPVPTPPPSGIGAEIDLGGPMASPSTPPPASVSSVHGIPVLPSFTQDDEPLDFDPEEIAEVAKFGPVPGGLVETIKYSFLVKSRVAELKDDASRLESSLEQARKDLKDELVRLGERARVAGFKSKLSDTLMAEVEAADRDAESAQDAIATERRRHRAAVEEIEEKLEALRKKMEGPRLRESKLAGELAAREESRRQLEQRLKRIEIEIRNSDGAIARAREASAAEEEGQDLAALEKLAQEAQEKLPKLQSQRQQFRAQNAQLDEPIEELRAAVETVRDQLRALKSERSALYEARDAEEVQHKKHTSGASNKSQEAQAVVHNKLAEIGRAVRLDRNAPAWALELFPGVDTKAGAFNRLNLDYQRSLQAAEAFDHASVKRGYLILGGGAGLILVGFIALLVLVALLT